MEIIQATNPAILDAEPIRELFRKAFTFSPVVKVDFDAAIPDILFILESPRFKVFLGQEDYQYKGLMVVSLPESLLFPYPEIVTFYNEGSKALSSALIKAGVDFGKANGYTRVWAINASGKPDPLWLRAFGKQAKPRVIGSLVEFDIT